LSEALKNDYVQIAILGVILLGSVFAFGFGLKVAFRTEYPLLAVASGSMIPTLNVGDLIVVQGIDANEINAAPRPNGTMIVFYRPNVPRRGGFLFFAGENELIVHRAIAEVENNGTWYFQTKGDNNYDSDRWGNTPPDTLNGMVSSKLLVGKVVAVVPWIGNVPLFIRTPSGLVLIIFLFILIIFLEFIPVLSKKQTTTEG